MKLLPTIRALGAVGLVASAVAAEEPSTLSEERRALFSVDESVSLAIEENQTQERGDAILRDVTFRGAPGTALDRVAAYIVKPKTAGVHAAILWVHWLGEPKTTNRTEFLEEATALASRGVVSVLPDAMWAAPGWYQKRVLAEDDDNSGAQVLALRRALALLTQEAGSVAPLAIVGHDYGGMYASIAAAVDRPPKTCVFVACTPSLLDWAFFVKKPESMDEYVAANRDFEPRDYVGTLQGASVLMQFAEKDRYVPLAKAMEFFSAAKGRKQMMIYGGADHSMVQPREVRTDRTAWLMRELGL